MRHCRKRSSYSQVRLDKSMSPVMEHFKYGERQTTNGAIESKWCNWELGYGDAQKYKKHIALFPMKPKNTLDSAYIGSEYMSIYPYIAYYDGTETYADGSPIFRGYYVRRQESDGKNYITPLADWFEER